MANTAEEQAKREREALEDFRAVVCHPFLRFIDNYKERNAALIARSWTAVGVEPEAEARLVTERGWDPMLLENQHLGIINGMQINFCAKAAPGWAAYLARAKTGVTEQDRLILSERLREWAQKEPSEYTVWKNAVGEQIKAAVACDVDRHVQGRYQRFDENKPQHRINLFKEVAQEELAPFGFTLDKSFSRKAQPVFSKPGFEDWKFVFLLDPDPLTRSLRIRGAPQGTLIAGFALMHESADIRGLDPLLHVVIGPTLMYRLSWRLYSALSSLRELEAFTTAHIDMYDIIRAEVEPAIIEGIQAAKEAKVGWYADK